VRREGYDDRFTYVTHLSAFDIELRRR
jgi:hypothetical protein